MAGLLVLLHGNKPRSIRHRRCAAPRPRWKWAIIIRAHDQARQAAEVAPRSRTAQMMLARTSLLLGEGVTGEAALDRALADGVPPETDAGGARRGQS